ncbi:ras guanine nucleotide exchange factor P [Drosophila grimshawi]|uniref:GH24559 n=1 Tax=Drosophila grimshawi TaxID=7222 RepID=B4JM15_DROGR|nr:ras guanine nucleotide exchange factor P [Drosophila grimshawi]EDV91776.1 GH24559 [Drosophila grimshawi]
MSNGKATAFFENGSTTQFEYCYKLYPQVLKMKAEKRSKKPQELIRLDQWFQNELPGLIKARGKDAHLVYDELVQAMKWKQSRGKFYPQLSYLVKVNTPRAVIQETKKAFRKLPNLEQAITALSNLKGVGTTMASALLTAAAPNSAPFMADECLMAIPEIEGIDYTTKEYLNFVQHIQSTVERLNAEVGGDTPHWSPHRVELALWAHYVANDLSPELLDDMPPPGSASAANNTNGSTLGKNSSKVLDGEDTNDGVAVDVDDESLGAGGGRNTATESETENENTNPPIALGKNNSNSNSNSNSNCNSNSNNNNSNSNNSNTAALQQDGDSNFVSNDSTSQEPIIEDNTTQTTATTTSTDDGEPIGGAGTPLASDSESNLEAPLKSRLTGSAAAAEAATATATEGAAAAAATAAEQTTHNNNKQINKNGATATAAATVGAANGNGNGTAAGNGVLSASSAAAADDDVDDDEEDDDDDDDEDEDENEDDELEADESNSSSSNLRASKLQQLTVAATAVTAVAPSIGQKRSALQSDMESNTNSNVNIGNATANAAPAAAADGEETAPELKKLRSD